MRLSNLTILLGACSSSPAAPARPEPPAPAPSDAARARDAAPDAGLPEAVLNAPPWIFRYTTADRNETWTLRHADGQALLVVESARGVLRYTGTAREGASLAIDVATSTAKLSLDCKPQQRALGSKCNDTKAPKRDVLDCYVPDFQQPMPFAPAPGVEYVVSASCTGYRLIP